MGNYNDNGSDLQRRGRASRVPELQGCLSETIIGSLIYIPLALLMLTASLPLVIHFGAEKGRYIAMVMWAIIIAVVYTLIKTIGLSADAVDA